ncbi:MAG: TIGR03546 family protein [bacterium]
MFWIIKIIKKFIKLLHSNVNPTEIAGGFALGSIIGLTPLFALHNILIFFLIIVLNVNIGAAFFGMLIFAIVGACTDPIAHWIGYYLLVTAGSLTPIWSSLYNMPIVPFTKFNNTVMLGSMVISLVLFVPILLGFKKFIIFYRKSLQEKVLKWKVVTIIKSTGIFKLYIRFRE